MVAENNSFGTSETLMELKTKFSVAMKLLSQLKIIISDVLKLFVSTTLSVLMKFIVLELLESILKLILKLKKLFLVSESLVLDWVSAKLKTVFKKNIVSPLFSESLNF